MRGKHAGYKTTHVIKPLRLTVAEVKLEKWSAMILDYLSNSSIMLFEKTLNTFLDDFDILKLFYNVHNIAKVILGLISLSLEVMWMGI